MLNLLMISVVAYAATNVDNLTVLLTLLAASRGHTRVVMAGHVCGSLALIIFPWVVPCSCCLYRAPGLACWASFPSVSGSASFSSDGFRGASMAHVIGSPRAEAHFRLGGCDGRHQQRGRQHRGLHLSLRGPIRVERRGHHADAGRHDWRLLFRRQLSRFTPAGFA
jgi:hypothetical protein